jgi:hypothetical protein
LSGDGTTVTGSTRGLIGRRGAERIERRLGSVIREGRATRRIEIRIRLDEGVRIDQRPFSFVIRLQILKKDQTRHPTEITFKICLVSSIEPVSNRQFSW